MAVKYRFFDFYQTVGNRNATHCIDVRNLILSIESVSKREFDTMLRVWRRIPMHCQYSVITVTLCAVRKIEQHTFESQLTGNAVDSNNRTQATGCISDAAPESWRKSRRTSLARMPSLAIYSQRYATPTNAALTPRGPHMELQTTMPPYTRGFYGIPMHASTNGFSP